MTKIPFHKSQLETLKIESLASLRKSIDMNIAQHEALDARTKLSIQEIVNAAENAFALPKSLILK
jgi:hypothetical protein